MEAYVFDNVYYLHFYAVNYFTHLEKMDTPARYSAMPKMFLTVCQEVPTLKYKNVLIREQSFPFRVDPF